jgi:hypothetical protein
MLTYTLIHCLYAHTLYLQMLLIKSAVAQQKERKNSSFGVRSTQRAVRVRDQ